MMDGDDFDDDDEGGGLIAARECRVCKKLYPWIGKSETVEILTAVIAAADLDGYAESVAAGDPEEGIVKLQKQLMTVIINIGMLRDELCGFCPDCAPTRKTADELGMVARPMSEVVPHGED